jgi:DNA-binding transcriptional MocR family regulator
MGQFLENGRYDQHLRNLRFSLQEYKRQFVATIAESFPAGTKVSRPEGGFMLWVEFAQELSTITLYEMALKRNVVIAPGRMFTLRKQFDNCIRLSYGIGWNEKIQEDLRLIGRLAKELLVGSPYSGGAATGQK